MASVGKRGQFLNYPEPLKGPDVPFKDQSRSNPVIKGWFILISAWCIERFRFIREAAWHNAGFGDLRPIATLIQDYEPWFEPTIIPRANPFEDQIDDDDTAKQPAAETAVVSDEDSALRNGYYTAADYRRLYLSGELTPTDVATAILPLIRRDTSPPGLHSVAWFDTKTELVLGAAASSTTRYQQNRSLGPLDGVPTGVKDEYDVDGYVTCHGSRNDYTGTIASEPAHGHDDDAGSITAWSVRRLEDAGAVVLGKLSMHEFGLDTSGNNPVYGTPPNPHNPGYYTGGSSSGTGYAVAAGLIPFGLGSDGGGSIRVPSSMCGVFGLKPTSGRLSFKPGQNHCVTCAVLGPIAGDMRTLAAIFEVTAAPHPSSAFPPLRTLRLEAPEKKVLGIPAQWFARADAGVQRLCRAMVDRLVSEHGYTTVEIEIPLLAEGQMAHAITVLTDGATLLPDTRGLTAANRILLALGGTTRATDWMLAQKLRRCLMQHLSYLWQTHGSEMMIVTPTIACGGWPVRGGEPELKYGISDGDTTVRTMEYVWLANFCGLPALSIPAGFVVPEGQPGAGDVADEDVKGRVPVGLMAMGEWCSEELLIQFGLDCERVGSECTARPGTWTDVIGLARKGKVTQKTSSEIDL